MRLFRKVDSYSTCLRQQHSPNCLYAESAFGVVASASSSLSASLAPSAKGSVSQPTVSGELSPDGYSKLDGDAPPAGKAHTHFAADADSDHTKLDYSNSTTTDNGYGGTAAEKCGNSILNAFSRRVAPGEALVPFTSSSRQHKLAYKERKRLCCRKSDAILLSHKHPEKTALIIERFRREKQLPQLPKCQFVVPRYTTVGQLQHVIRMHLFDQSNMAIFVVVRDEIPALTATVEELAAKYRDEDGFLYLHFSSEDCFG